MDLRFTELQEMLKTSAKDFLTSECPKTKVKELEESEKGYSPEMWKKMADLGWMGLIIPDKYGGGGCNFQDLMSLIEEMGRNILPAPFICNMVSTFPILEVGTEEQKKEFLPKIAKGESIFTMTHLEESGSFNISGITTKAVLKGDDYVINGTKLFVEMGHIADYLICVAKTSAKGISLFIVDAKTPGIQCEVMPTMAMDKLCEVRFKNVKVPKKNLLGELDKGWQIVETIMRKGAIAKCAESIGAMQACVDMTVAYSKERVQYERPIGAFQAVQHLIADIWTAMQTSRFLVYEAAWMESEGMDSTKEVSMSKAYANEAYKFVTKWGVRLYGGIGTSREHDISLYYRRAKAADYAFGSTDFHRNIVADKIGLK
ncbi:MAG: acyl-CoA dehydrogenase family protein [Chloroflexota bacterium]